MSPLVLHVLPLDLPRGAQRYARAMRDELDGDELRHRTLTLFRSDTSVLNADFKLDHARDWTKYLGVQPRTVLALRSALQHHRPAIVVAHGSEPLKYTIATRSHLPLVYYKIGTSTPRGSRGARRALHAALLQRAHAVAGVSQECLDEARDVFGVPSHKLRLIPNGRDPRQFTPHRDTSDGVPMLTFIGHLTATKRPERFIELVRRLKAMGVPLRAQIIGDGPLLATLRGPAAALEIEVLGRRDDVPELLRRSAVMAFTSLPDSEGLPGVFIEAGLSGIPVVATDVPGARTAILDQQSGFVVGVADFEALVERTHRLLTDAALRRQMGDMARSHCERELSLERSLARWRELFRELSERGAE